jgi:glycosyltransferase involved in cell wall biosynthesis
MEEKKLIILLKSFPKISETFILQELVLLSQRGFDPIIYARVKPKEETIVHSLMKQLKIKDIRYLPLYSLKTRMIILCLFLKTIIQFGTKVVWKIFMEGRRNAKNDIYKQSILCFYAAIWIIHDLKLCKGAKYHIHAQFLDYPTEIAWIINQLTGIEYSISSHAKDIYTTSKEDIQKYIYQATKIKTCTEYNRIYLSELVGDEKVERIYHGVNCDFFSMQKLQTKIRLLSVARLVEKKGFINILKALDILRIKYPDFIYTIIGHGELHNVIVDYIEFLDIKEHILIIPYATQEVVRDYLSISDVFINASLVTKNGDRDGIPNSVAEAMAMEIPVIATNISGITELVKHKETGYLAESNNAMSIYEGIMYYIENKDAKEMIIRNAFQLIQEHFSAQKVFERCELFYRSLLK